MLDQSDILETLLRAAAGGMSFLLAAVLAVKGAGGRTQNLGALFTFSVGVYVLLSGVAIVPLFGILTVPAIFISIGATVFFWWFATSLLDDGFQWYWWRFIPIVLLPALYFLRQVMSPGELTTALLFLHLGVNAALFADIFRIAIINLADDLVDPRRRFRVAIAIIISVLGISIAFAEIAENLGVLPDALLMVQAVVILALNFSFTLWMVRPIDELFGVSPAIQQEIGDEAAPDIPAADRPAYEKLLSLMNEGAYRQDGLTVAGLAGLVGVPEHQLRKLINQRLGFRNFSAFLNARRIAEAKSMLADPNNARKQVLQIALELGYGSIAPFNRAFKQATGMPPSEYRKNAL